jgi:uncharacterized protein with GYD domain
MGRYMFHGTYSVDGVKGLLKEGGTGRRAAVEAALKSFGGRLESMYYAFGDTDVYVVVDGIDNVTAAAFSLGVGASGGFGRVNTTVLLTPEEIDQAGKKTISYRAPGR